MASIWGRPGCWIGELGESTSKVDLDVERERVGGPAVSKATRVSALTKAIADAPTWTAPTSVNRTVVGGAPTGAWVPTVNTLGDAHIALGGTIAAAGGVVSATAVGAPVGGQVAAMGGGGSGVDNKFIAGIIPQDVQIPGTR